MAKHPEDHNPKRKRDDKEADAPLPTDHVDEVEQVLDAEEVEPVSHPIHETHTARPSPQPTRIAPYQADAAEPTETAAEPEDKAPAAMPNLSLDEPRQAGRDHAGEDVLEDEPVLAESVSGASSVVEVAEVVEEDSDVHDVFADDQGHAPRSSSIIEIAELAEIMEDESPHVLAEVVEDGSPGVLSEVKAAPATPPPMSDDLFVSDVLDTEGDQGQETSSIFGKGAGGEAKPIATDSMAHREEAFEEILAAESSGQHPVALPEEVAGADVPKNAKAPGVEDDTVDLGSDPELHVDPSSLQKIRKEKMRAAAEEAAHATEDINWDDVIEDEESAAVESGNKEGGAVAEAVETGVNVESGAQPDAEKNEKAKREVTFDDLDAERDETPLSAKKSKDEAGIYEEDDLDSSSLRQEVDGVQFDEEDTGGAKETAAGGADHAADDLAAQALLDDAESLAGNKTGEGILEDGARAEEPNKSAQEDAEPPAKNKGKKEAAFAGASKRAAKTWSGRGVLVGTCLATLVLGGAAAAVWYAKPDLLEGVSKSSPNYTPPKKEKAKVAPLAVQARAHMDSREFDKALNVLKDADKTPLNLSTRAEARWLKYLQETGTDKSLDKNAPEVKLVLADLDEAGNDLLKTQVTRVLDAGGAKGNEKDILDLQDKVKKAENAQRGAEKGLLELRDVLVKEKYLDATDKLDPAALQKITKELTDSKSSLTAVNKMLEDAKIDDAGDKGVARLLTAKKDVDEKLEAINKVLADTKFKDEGVKGLAEMIAAEGKLTKERDQLDQVVKTAYQELAAGGLVPPSDDASGQLVEAVKVARQKAESAANTLKELTDPAANYLPRAEKLAAQGNLPQALEVVDLGLKALPDNPRFLALRGLVRLEGAHGNRKRIEALQKEIRQDAEKASRDAATAAEGAYVLGLLDESLGNYDRAENDYRKALTAHRGSADEASRYVIALARLLQRDRATDTAPAVPAKEGSTEPSKQKTKENIQQPKKVDPKNDQARLVSLRTMVVLSAVAAHALDAGNDKSAPASARIQESISLAHKLIQSANPKIKGQGYMILGQAMFKNGKHKEGLKEYVSGLELLHPGDQTRDMFKLLTVVVPALQPEVESPRSNPVLAEQLFGNGLNLFWAGRYAEAESRFQQAIRHYQDARFEYYLGMSLMAQPSDSKRRAAYAAFEQGARLEASNRPSMGEINASLERIQGTLRTYVNSFREKTRTAAN